MRSSLGKVDNRKTVFQPTVQDYSDGKSLGCLEQGNSDRQFACTHETLFPIPDQRPNFCSLHTKAPERNSETLLSGHNSHSFLSTNYNSKKGKISSPGVIQHTLRCLRQFSPPNPSRLGSHNRPPNPHLLHTDYQDMITCARDQFRRRYIVADNPTQCPPIIALFLSCRFRQ